MRGGPKFARFLVEPRIPSPWLAWVRRAAVSALWEQTVGAAPELLRWLAAGPSELKVARLPRPAWAIVAGSLARACHARGLPLLVMVRPWRRRAGR